MTAYHREAQNFGPYRSGTMMSGECTCFINGECICYAMNVCDCEEEVCDCGDCMDMKEGCACGGNCGCGGA